eukprot:1069285-Amphidinium_carterae.1
MAKERLHNVRLKCPDRRQPRTRSVECQSPPTTQNNDQQAWRAVTFVPAWYPCIVLCRSFYSVVSG